MQLVWRSEVEIRRRSFGNFHPCRISREAPELHRRMLDPSRAVDVRAWESCLEEVRVSGSLKKVTSHPDQHDYTILRFVLGNALNHHNRVVMLPKFEVQNLPLG